MSGGIRILNVDDDEIKRYTISRILRKAGFEVEEAENGGDTLLRARALPDLIVLDVNLPDMSGFDVCRRLKSDAETSGIPVIHLTASFMDPGHRVYGLDAGADAYLTQDVDAEELIATIKAVLRSKAAAESAKKMAREWQATFRSITSGICVLRTDGTVERFNPVFAQIFCRPDFELMNRKFAEILRAASFSAQDREVSDILRQDRPHTFEVIDGESGRSFDLTIDPVQEDHGATCGYVCTLIETTEKKRAGEELKRLDDALRERVALLAESDYRKDEFLAMLSHELRNPLGAINAALFLISRAKGGGKQAEQAYDVINRQVQQLNRLVDDLLDLTRITQGKIELRREDVDFREIVEKAAEAVSAEATEKNVSLTTRLPGVPLPVFADKARLQQVLVNLLNNAVKYTPGGGALTVEAAGAHGVVSAKVKDTGIGIAGDILPRIFEPFTQAEKTRDRKAGGLGIGLAIVKRLVEMHGGTVSVESAGLGRGSVFTVALPYAPEGAPRAEAAARPDSKTADAPRCVLVVDDNQDNADMAVAVLEQYGHRVHVAYDGISGLEQAQALHPEAVLLDLGLPGLDGHEVARRLRQLKGFEQVLLVAVSGYGREADLQLSQDAGFDYHLVKPVDYTRLLSLIEQGRS